MQRDIDIEELNQQIFIDSAFLDDLKKETGKVIVGQGEMIDALLIGLLTKGHILLEGLPGLAKTLSIRALAASINASFNRIQFTPDLLPADITGTMIYNAQSGDFNVRKGPVFANFILADEINRAPAKVQSALLEAMQERQVTIGKESFQLEDPFLVLATQNPIEQEGTYPLPEAQLDRFMLKINIGYPSKEEEREIMRRNLNNTTLEAINPVVTKEHIVKARNSIAKIYMDEKIENYILDIIFASRQPENYGLAELKPYLSFGASPRASINIALAAKANAFLNRRGYVIPEDVRSVSRNVLKHRLGLTYEAEAENINQEKLISAIINKIQVP
jgi:MoxR-like ATPase